MNYTLRQLEIFLEIVEKKSVTKASESLFLSQPAVSIQLKKFQDQFPIALTEIIGRRLHITGFGEEIATAARKILSEVSKIDHKTNLYQGKLAGKLSISVVSTGKYVMPYYLSDFVNRHPTIDFTMDVTNKLKVIDDIENNRVDFALVSVLPEHLDLQKLPLLENSLHLVASKSREENRKGHKNTIFSTQPLLFREHGSATRNAMETYVESRKFKISKRIVLTSNEALKQAVIAGLGYSIMPMIGIRNVIEKGDIVTIPFEGLPIKTQWNLVWLKHKNLSPVAEAYIEFLKAEKQNITNKYFKWVE